MIVGATTAGTAGTITVRPDGGGDFPTIQAALEAARPGDVIELADGIYTGEGNHDLDYGGKAVTVRSRGGDPAACVIDCAGGDWETPHRGFFFHSEETAASRLIGITITNGQALGDQSPEGSGGAILFRYSSPTVSDCVFLGNRAEAGGAIACEFSAPRLVRCVLRDNTAEHGGGAQIFRNAPVLEGCIFDGNAAASGGGLYCHGATPTLQDCTFNRNTASYGGGMSCEEKSAPVVAGCLFSGNFAALGGGLVAVASTPLVRHCTFVANAAGSGGGICGRNGAGITVRNSILVFSLQGEGLACDEGSQADVACSLIFGNGDGDWVGRLAGLAGAHGNLRADPLFVDGGGGDFRLQPDSPCRVDRPGCGTIGDTGRK